MAWALHAPECVTLPDAMILSQICESEKLSPGTFTYWLRHFKYVTTSRAQLIHPWSEDKDSKTVLDVKWDIADTWLFGCFFWPCMWHVESWFPDQGWNPCPLHWKCRVLTSGPHGKSFFFPLKYSYVLFQLCYYRNAITVTTKWLLNEWANTKLGQKLFFIFFSWI